MTEKSIWYQGGKVALVILFAVLMALLFFSCSAEQKEWVIRTNTEIKFMHIVWIVVGVALIFGLLYLFYTEMQLTEEYKKAYLELDEILYFAKNCSKARKNANTIIGKIQEYRASDKMEDKTFSDKVWELNVIYFNKFVKKD